MPGSAELRPTMTNYRFAVPAEGNARRRPSAGVGDLAPAPADRPVQATQGAYCGRRVVPDVPPFPGKWGIVVAKRALETGNFYIPSLK